MTVFSDHRLTDSAALGLRKKQRKSMTCKVPRAILTEKLQCDQAACQADRVAESC